MISGAESFAITLYVPDEVLAQLRDTSELRNLFLFEIGSVDFLCLGWWEESYTARLGLVGFQSSKEEKKRFDSEFSLME